jgi:hypothetical protein
MAGCCVLVAGCGGSDGPVDLGVRDLSVADATADDGGGGGDAAVTDAGPLLTACDSNRDCAGGEVCR